MKSEYETMQHKLSIAVSEAKEKCKHKLDSAK